MPMTKRLGAYTDVHAVLEKVIAEKGGQLKFPSAAKAVHFRQRVYYYRKLLGDQFPEFDTISLRVEDDVLLFLNAELDAVFTSPSGVEQKIEPKGFTPLTKEDFSPTEVDEELLDDALQLIRRNTET